MEPASGVELFIRAPDQSVKFSVYRVMMTHDDDDEVHIREKLTYELEKTVTLYIWKDEMKSRGWEDNRYALLQYILTCEQ